MRIIEAIIACSLVLIAHYFLSYSSSSISSEHNVELETLGQNLLNTLEDQSLIMSVINNETNWQSSLKELVESILPPDVLYTINMKSLYSNKTLVNGITNTNNKDNQSAYDVASVQGVYTFSYPLLQKQNVNLDIVLVMDRSGSMDDPPRTTYDKIYYAKQAARNFVDRLNSSIHRVGLVSFSTTSTFDLNLTSNYISVKNKINATIADGFTNMEGGIHKAYLQFQNHSRTWVMILLSDGMANWWDNKTGNDLDYITGARKAFEQALIAQSMKIKIYTIGLGAKNDINETNLKQIQTEGYYYAPSGSDLDAIYQAIAEDIINEVKYDVLLIQITLKKSV